MNYLETIIIRDLRLKINGDLGMFLFVLCAIHCIYLVRVQIL